MVMVEILHFIHCDFVSFMCCDLFFTLRLFFCHFKLMLFVFRCSANMKFLVSACSYVLHCFMKVRFDHSGPHLV